MNPRNWFSRLKDLPSTQLLPQNLVFILFGSYWRCLIKEALYSAHFGKNFLPWFHKFVFFTYWKF